MKTIFSEAMIPLTALLLAGVNAKAATFSNLYNFTLTSFPVNTNSDGANPHGGLVLSGNTLYGTASSGGSSNFGTLFRLDTDGTGFTNLVNFTGSNGKNPYAGLALAGGSLYGTTAGGGSGSFGTAFKINTDGSGYTNFLNFTYNTAGNGVFGGLAVSSNALYGTTDGGGTGFSGTVFKANTDGTGFGPIHSFASSSSNANTDGKYPDDTLVLSGNSLYGTATSGGSFGNGAIFRVNIDGTGFTNLYSFTTNSSTFPNTNTDGRSPRAGLVVSGNTLYGTARFAGSGASGTVFKLNTDGTGFGVLHSFSAISSGTNADGAAPWGGLCLSGNTLYGTAAVGGDGGSGTVFKLNTDGTGFSVLYSFTATSGSSYTNSDGATPFDGLTLSTDNKLYGTTESGGTGGSGTVFALTLASTPAPLPLNIQLIGGKAILSWNDPGLSFSLQAAPAVIGLYSNVPVALSPYTNPITGSRSFFRLKGN